MPAKKTAKAPIKKEPESHLGEYDIELDYNVCLRDRHGDIVTVKGVLPLTNATIPAFLADSQKTITESFDQVVKNRFLLQVRHFFNAKKEEDLKKTTPQTPKQLTVTKPSKVEKTMSTDEAFSFEEEDTEQDNEQAQDTNKKDNE